MARNLLDSNFQLKHIQVSWSVLEPRVYGLVLVVIIVKKCTPYLQSYIWALERKVSAQDILGVLEL